MLPAQIAQHSRAEQSIVSSLTRVATRQRWIPTPAGTSLRTHSTARTWVPSNRLKNGVGWAQNQPRLPGRRMPEALAVSPGLLKCPTAYTAVWHHRAESQHHRKQPPPKRLCSLETNSSERQNRTTKKPKALLWQSDFGAGSAAGPGPHWGFVRSC